MKEIKIVQQRKYEEGRTKALKKVNGEKETISRRQSEEAKDK